MKFLPPDVSNLHTMRKAANGLAKGHLSHAKRPSFARQFAVFYNLPFENQSVKKTVCRHERKAIQTTCLDGFNVPFERWKQLVWNGLTKSHKPHSIYSHDFRSRARSPSIGLFITFVTLYPSVPAASRKSFS